MVIGSSKSSELLLQAAKIQVIHSTFETRISLKPNPHALWLQKHVSDRPNPTFNSDPTGTAHFHVSRLRFPFSAHHSAAGRAG